MENLTFGNFEKLIKFVFNRYAFTFFLVTVPFPAAYYSFLQLTVWHPGDEVEVAPKRSAGTTSSSGLEPCARGVPASRARGVPASPITPAPVRNLEPSLESDDDMTAIDDTLAAPDSDDEWSLPRPPTKPLRRPCFEVPYLVPPFVSVVSRCE